MPRQGLATRCAPVQPCEHRPLEIHASTPPGIAPSWCISLSLPGRHAASEVHYGAPRHTPEHVCQHRPETLGRHSGNVDRAAVEEWIGERVTPSGAIET